MHRFQSSSAIQRFRLASFLVFLKYLLIPTALGVLAWSLVQNDRRLTFVALGIGGVALLATLIQWIISTKTRCPLCMVPVLGSNGCSKNRNARRLFGSYRLRVAVSSLFRGHFRCPYCNEPSALQVRSRPR